jgi:serine/threonine-protein kinase
VRNSGLTSIAARYSIVREIGRGGVAVVFEAVDSDTEESVAIKVLRPELVASVSAQRFLREIHFLRDLTHPNILPIIDAFETDELPYFVMPYARGGSLRERLRQHGPIPLDVAHTIARDLASAIDYAHSRNILHRDIKPENVLFDGPRSLLCDFGIARAIVLSATEPHFSSSGVVVGTPLYMSPEQFLLDAPIDGACDVYALGCVVYEMLTAEPPFAMSNALTLAWAHATQPPRSIRSVRPEVPVTMEAAVLAAMEKDVRRRPSSATAFVEQLR